MQSVAKTIPGQVTKERNVMCDMRIISSMLISSVRTMLIHVHVQVLFFYQYMKSREAGIVLN